MRLLLAASSTSRNVRTAPKHTTTTLNLHVVFTTFDSFVTDVRDQIDRRVRTEPQYWEKQSVEESEDKPSEDIKQVVSAEQDPTQTDGGGPRQQRHVEDEVDGIQTHEERGDEASTRHVAGRERVDVGSDRHERVGLTAGRPSPAEHRFQHTHQDYVRYQTCNFN